MCRQQGGSSVWRRLGLHFDTGLYWNEQRREAGSLSPAWSKSQTAATVLITLTLMSGTARNQDAAA